MKKPVKSTLKTIVGIGIVLSIGAGGVFAAGHLDKIKQRQEAMKAVGGGIKILVGTAKGEMAFDAAKIKAAALAIKTNLEKAQKLFPEGTGEGSGVENRAKPEIWLNPEGFSAAFKKGIAAADNMMTVADKGALMPALGQVGASCKACHEGFRAPKK